jgi:DNA-binding GntR family transcriptional regulator
MGSNHAPQIFRAFHDAFYKSASNPFLRLGLSDTAANDPAQLFQSADGKERTKALLRRVDAIADAVGPARFSDRGILF